MTPRVRQRLISLFAALVVCTVIFATIATWKWWADPREAVQYLQAALVFGMCAVLTGIVVIIPWELK